MTILFDITKLEKNAPQQKTPRPQHNIHKITYKLTYKTEQTHTQKHIHKTKQKQYSQKYSKTYIQAYTETKTGAHPQTAPHKTEQQKNILPYIIVSIV